MSLKGSLQTAALPEVLKFLADTGKSGDLHIRGSFIEGRVWFSDGTLSGLDVDRSSDPGEAFFQLLRNADGDFTFSNGDGHPEDGHSVHGCDLSSALESAEARLAEWSEITNVVPSLEHCVTLAPTAPADSVVMDRDQWAMIVAIGEGRTVAQTIDANHLGEFDGCRAVKVLVESGLVEIAEPDRPHFTPVPVVEPLAIESEVESLSAVESFSAVEALPVIESLPVIDYSSTEGSEDADVEASVDSPAVEAEEPYTESDAVGSDHYASLRAMIVDVDKDLSDAGDAVPGPSLHGKVDETSEEPMDGKAALQALLAEVSSYPVEDSDAGESQSNGDTHPSDDGLADRGPWPEHELASFNGWNEPEAAADDVADDEDPADEAPTEEPINRGLLLKFLSSVRN